MKNACSFIILCKKKEEEEEEEEKKKALKHTYVFNLRVHTFLKVVQYLISKERA